MISRRTFLGGLATLPFVGGVVRAFDPVECDVSANFHKRYRFRFRRHVSGKIDVSMNGRSGSLTGDRGWTLAVSDTWKARFRWDGDNLDLDYLIAFDKNEDFLAWDTFVDPRNPRSLTGEFEDLYLPCGAIRFNTNA